MIVLSTAKTTVFENTICNVDPPSLFQEWTGASPPARSVLESTLFCCGFSSSHEPRSSPCPSVIDCTNVDGASADCRPPPCRDDLTARVGRAFVDSGNVGLAGAVFEVRVKGTGRDFILRVIKWLEHLDPYVAFLQTNML